MPDWFYRTVAQRTLFALPGELGREVALVTIGTLGRSAPGRAVIEFLGHMAPPAEIATTLGDTRLVSPIGLGWRVDPQRRALRGLAGFGVGAIEVCDDAGSDVVRGADHGLEDRRSRPATRLPPAPPGVVVLHRRGLATGREVVRLPDGRELPVCAWDDPPAPHGEGVLLQVGRRVAEGWIVPARAPHALAEAVAAWRRLLPEGAPVIVSGGVDQETDATALLRAGATLVLLEAGLVFRGPGLVKRCNAAVVRLRGRPATLAAAGPLFRRAWFWACVLGAALALGGVAALALALTRVLLPYDEAFLGLTSAALARTSPRLFAFMAHDRATLAGTMLGLGWLYFVLGHAAIRRDEPGARTTVIASALAGFATFFSFFGFGYFDTLHAFVAAVLFQITVQVMVGQGGDLARLPTVPDPQDAAWRRAQWGQLAWIVHAVGLLIAGGLILGIGMTAVFVTEDLNFLCLTPDAARALDARLFSVVAHDRATLGGMLLSSGVAMLLPALWCFRRGAHWLWLALAGLGVPAYVATLGIHGQVGYTDPRHLVPAFIGLALWLAGLVLSRGYLSGRPDAASERAA